MKCTVSAIVFGFPPCLKKAQPLQGESIAKFVIRHHKNQWKNFTESMTEKLNLNNIERTILLNEDTNIQNEALQDEIMRFMNMRLPTHFRTIKDLAVIKKRVNRSDRAIGMIAPFQIGKIWFPKPRIDSQTKRLIEDLGVDVVNLGAEGTTIDICHLSSEIGSDFIWFVPGGTRVSFTTTLKLQRIIQSFEENAKYALYSDNHYSLIYRCSAINEASKKGYRMTGQTDNDGAIFKKMGYQPIVDHESEQALCELERIYGGWNSDFTGIVRNGSKSVFLAAFNAIKMKVLRK